MSVKLTLFQGNSAVVTIPMVTNATTGAPVTGATITATLYTPADVAVAGYIDVPLVPVSGTPGAYSMVIPASFNVPEGSYYYVFSGQDGVGDGFTYEQDVEVRVRE